MKISNMLIFFYFLFNCWIVTKSRSSDCNDPTLYLKNTLSLGIVGKYIWQYTLNHHLVKYKIKFILNPNPRFIKLYLIDGDDIAFKHWYPLFWSSNKTNFPKKVASIQNSELIKKASFVAQISNVGNPLLIFYSLSNDNIQYIWIQDINDPEKFHQMTHKYDFSNIGYILPIWRTDRSNVESETNHLIFAQNLKLNHTLIHKYSYLDYNLTTYHAVLCFVPRTYHTKIRMQMDIKGCESTASFLSLFRFAFTFNNYIYLISIRRNMVYIFDESLLEYPFNDVLLIQRDLMDLFRCTKKENMITKRPELIKFRIIKPVIPKEELMSDTRIKIVLTIFILSIILVIIIIGYGVLWQNPENKHRIIKTGKYMIKKSGWNSKIVIKWRSFLKKKYNAGILAIKNKIREYKRRIQSDDFKL